MLCGLSVSIGQFMGHRKPNSDLPKAGIRGRQVTLQNCQKLREKRYQFSSYSRLFDERHKPKTT
jgi:hypothetical protein